MDDDSYCGNSVKGLNVEAVNFKDRSSGVDVNSEVLERSWKIISTGTPFRLLYGDIHL